MTEEYIKVEITLAPDLYVIAQSVGDISAFIDIALTAFIASVEFYDYLYLNKLKIHEIKKARYLQGLKESNLAWEKEEDKKCDY
jgi:hypothetical protein